MNLFDKNLISALPKFEKYNYPALITLLTLHGKNINKHRNELRRWFKKIPLQHQKDLKSRLESIDNEQHISALYELVWHQFFLEEGWKPTIHPTLSNSTHKPDFLVKTSNGKNFYFEVATVFENKNRQLSDKRVNLLLEYLDHIQSYFTVNIYLRSELPPDFNIKKAKAIAVFLENELNKLNPYKQGHRKGGINRVYRDKGIEIEFNMWAYKRHIKRRVIGSWGGPVRMGNDSLQISKALNKKINKYKGIKESGVPLVLAICTDPSPTVDEHALDTALFGNHTITWTVNSRDPNTKWGRDNSGLITPKPAFVRNTRLSAVVFCERRFTTKRTEYKVKVFHNPWAANPLPLRIFKKMPQLVITEKTEDKLSMDWSTEENIVIYFN